VGVVSKRGHTNPIQTRKGGKKLKTDPGERGIKNLREAGPREDEKKKRIEEI